MILTRRLHTVSHKLRSAERTKGRQGRGRHLLFDKNSIATDYIRQTTVGATTVKSSTGVVGAGTLNGKYGSSR